MDRQKLVEIAIEFILATVLFYHYLIYRANHLQLLKPYVRARLW